MNGAGFDETFRKYQKFIAKPPAPLPVRLIPFPANGHSRAFRGMCEKEPCDYEVTAVIPTLNSFARVTLVIDLLRLQTVRPFILVIDGGSSPRQLQQLRSLSAQDVEVQSLQLNGVSHSSEPVSMAMDVAFALCRTRFMFCTHDDCFLMNRLAIQYLRDLAATHKAAGHQLTPRPHSGWEKMVGHTALMLDYDFCMDRGITWNMRRLIRMYGVTTTRPTVGRPNFPDTEIGLNILLEKAGIKPFLTGKERNYCRNRDGLIDHCRSYGSAEIYKPDHLAQATQWIEAATQDAKQRIRDWASEELPQAYPLPAVPVKASMKFPKFDLTWDVNKHES